MILNLITYAFDLAHDLVRYRNAGSYERDISSLQAQNELSAPSTYCVTGPPITPKVAMDNSYYTAQANFVAERLAGESVGDQIADYIGGD